MLPKIPPNCMYGTLEFPNKLYCQLIYTFPCGTFSDSLNPKIAAGLQLKVLYLAIFVMT